MSILAALVMLAALQDPEARYREALFHEVDAGDLQKAIDAYQAIESDAAAPESVRAKAAFRRAWCLEKKGRRADAERGYREMASKYPAQAETVEKAKERLDRLVAGPAAPAPVSQEQRIADHILSMGSGSEASWQSHRALVLIGDPAVPALRKAMKHKDVTLSAMAASVLVELEKDEGTYAPLLRRLRSSSHQYYGPLAALLKRSESDRKRFVEEFTSERDSRILEYFLGLLKWVSIPELRPRLQELLIQGEKSVAEGAAGLLSVTREDELLDLLDRMGKDGADRSKVESLLKISKVKVADPRTLALRLTTLVVLPDSQFYFSIRGLEPRIDVLRECIVHWLKSGNAKVREEAIRWVYLDPTLRYRLALSLLGEPIDEKERSLLVVNLVQDGGPPEPGIRAEVEKALWSLAEKEKGEVRDSALRGLMEMIPEGHPRWEELFVWLFKKRTWRGISMLYRNYKQETQEKVRRLTRDLIKKAGDAEARLEAMELSISIDDPERYPILADLAADESLSKKIRNGALEDLVNARDVKPFGPKLLPLLKDPDPVLRRHAVRAFRNWRDEEMKKLMTTMLVDPDHATAQAAMDWFARLPPEEILDVCFKAFKSGSPAVREKAAQLTGSAESVQAVPHLIKLLDDPSEHVRLAARGALERIRKRHEEKAQWLEWYERVKPK